jgi:pimeloyl-ACP methyl ester carboxylesterase
MNRRVAAVLAMLLLVAVAAVRPVAAAGAVRIYQGSIAGAQYRIEVPDRWNGTLLLWSHGLYPPGFLPEEVQLTNQPATKAWLLDHGHAIAGSNYRTPTGWSVREALDDQVALLDWFAEHIGQPRRTIAAGSSMGGLVAVLLAERNPHRFDGVASLCGPLAGGLGLWNTWLDVNFAIKTLLAPGSELPLTHLGDPAATVARVQQLIAQALMTAQGRARLALAGALAAIPGWSRAFEPRPREVALQVRQQADWLSLFLLEISWGSARADLEQRAGGNPTWNVGVDYRRQLARSSERHLVRQAYREAGISLRADLDRLAKTPRVRADPGAAAFLARYGTPRGITPWPVVTLHTLGDGGVAVEHQRAYAAGVRRSGVPARLRQLFIDRAGHCLFTAGEETVTYQALLGRIDTGRWRQASPGALNAAARRLGAPYQQLFDWMAEQAGVAQPAFTSYRPGPFLRPAPGSWASGLDGLAWIPGARAPAAKPGGGNGRRARPRSGPTEGSEP